MAWGSLGRANIPTAPTESDPQRVCAGWTWAPVRGQRLQTGRECLTGKAGHPRPGSDIGIWEQEEAYWIYLSAQPHPWPQRALAQASSVGDDGSQMFQMLPRAARPPSAAEGQRAALSFPAEEPWLTMGRGLQSFRMPRRTSVLSTFLCVCLLIALIVCLLVVGLSCTRLCNAEGGATSETTQVLFCSDIHVPYPGAWSKYLVPRRTCVQ